MKTQNHFAFSLDFLFHPVSAVLLVPPVQDEKVLASVRTGLKRFGVFTGLICRSSDRETRASTV